MGQPKALLDWHGTPLITAHLHALSVHCGHLIVVLGSQSDLIARAIPAGVEIRRNVDWEQTQMSDSLRIGLAGVSGMCVFTPVDVPPVPAAILKSLLEQPGPAVSRFDGQDGHPVLFDAETTFLDLARTPLDQSLASAARLDVDWPGCTESWNTPAQWRAQSPAGS